MMGARTSTYTVLGFIGYGVAAIACSVLSLAWGMTARDRLVCFFVPPIAFLAVVSIVRRRLRRERIVFYQTASAAVVSATAIAAIAGGHAARVCDVATLGIGVFLVFGRIGCFSVACCHGRPARRGVVYGPAHVAVGFWARWVGRALWPTQLVEAAVSLVLVIAALALGWRSPGTPALVYIVAYGLARFALELVRGDAGRPYALGASEAQWTALATVVACAIWRPAPATIAAALGLAAACGTLVVRRARRALVQPAHLRELDRACMAASTEGGKHETSLGVEVSCHDLPDGRTDWILSSTSPRWSAALARQLAAALWLEHELVEGRIGSIVHVLVPRAPERGAMIVASP